NNRKVWLALRDLFPHPYTADDASKFLQNATIEQPTTNFCIEVDGAAAGGIGIRLGHDVHRHTAEVGYWLCEDLLGRGIVTEAVAAFTDFCTKFCAPPRLCRTVRKQFCLKACARENRFHFRGTPEEQRRQRWGTSRFRALRENEVDWRKPRPSV